MTARTTEPSSVCRRGNVRDPSADGAANGQCARAAGWSCRRIEPRRGARSETLGATVQIGRARVAMWIHCRTSRALGSQGRTPQRTPSHLRCAASFAMSPSVTNATVGRRPSSLLGSASACEAITTSGVERSERSTAAHAGVARILADREFAAAAGRGAPLWPDCRFLAKEKTATTGPSPRVGPREHPGS